MCSREKLIEIHIKIIPNIFATRMIWYTLTVSNNSHSFHTRAYIFHIHTIKSKTPKTNILLIKFNFRWIINFRASFTLLTVISLFSSFSFLNPFLINTYSNNFQMSRLTTCYDDKIICTKFKNKNPETKRIKIRNYLPPSAHLA